MTVVRVDAEGDASVSLRPFTPAEMARNMTPIYPPIRCTTIVDDNPCGHCWYCQQAAGAQLTLIPGGAP